MSVSWVVRLHFSLISGGEDTGRGDKRAVGFRGFFLSFAVDTRPGNISMFFIKFNFIHIQCKITCIITIPSLNA